MSNNNSNYLHEMKLAFLAKLQPSMLLQDAQSQCRFSEAHLVVESK